MRVLAIDPGFDRLGLAILEGDPSKPQLVWSTCVTPAKGTQERRLAAVSRAVEEAIETYAPDLVALETLFFSTNKKTALSVAEARGAILAVAGRAELPIPHLLSLPEKKRLDDELDAIAVGIAALAARYPQA
jgi:crossover junction endodeoxyribonuclease RuvC